MMVHWIWLIVAFNAGQLFLFLAITFFAGLDARRGKNATD